MLSLHVSFFLLICAFFVRETVAWMDEMIGQSPIDLSPPPRNGQAGQGSRRKPGKHNKIIGESCTNNSQCKNGLCCVLGSGGKVCRPKARIGHPCSDGQVKGGYYPDHCPCARGGEDKCLGKICQATF
uniref:Prokineticin domain-containing protein n=1 Tax=Amblyomma maculatum TaxID=34609 RepID=G3MTJ3_AMBMU